MCDILTERIRINKILNEAIDDGFGVWSMQTDELVQRCFVALQAAYHGSCVDECLKARAVEFVAAHLTQRKAEGDAGFVDARRRISR
jgi:hypothetical protein